MKEFLTFNIVVILLKFSIAARGSLQHKVLNDARVHYLSDLTDLKYTDKLYKNLLVPRVVGTQGHENVATFIIDELAKLGYEIEVDEFKAKTPNFGVLTFKNIIGRLNPNAKKFVALACHYDSKFFREFKFIGATDSAVPCAMMLNLAKVMQNDLNNSKNRTDISLKLIFFDGEEAFEHWGPNDSIYGAKHLAAKWNRTLRDNIRESDVSHIKSIEVLVLLDLLGAKNPKFYSFLGHNATWYKLFLDSERQLAQLGLLNDYTATYFKNRNEYSYIEDDHIPFLQRGVEIVHLIPLPFPFVWHREDDNADAIDSNVVENLNKILRVFVAKSLHLFEDNVEKETVEVPKEEL